MPNRKRVLPIDEVKRMYGESMTLRAIAKHYGTTWQIVRRHLRDSGVTVKGRGGRNEIWAFTHRYEEQIRALHAEGLNCREIADKLGLRYPALYYRARVMGLHFESIKAKIGIENLKKAHAPEAVARAVATREANGGVRGSRNPRWKGGISERWKTYASDWSLKLKAEIRHRDDNRCQSCGKNGDGRNLDVHHLSCNGKDSRPENLITLCRSCHKLVHFGKLSLSR